MIDFLNYIENSKIATPLLEKRGNFCVDEFIGTSLLISSYFSKKHENCVVIAPNLYSAQKLCSSISNFIGEESVLLFPSDELLRSEALSSSKEFLSQRLFVMSQLLTDKHFIVVSHSSSVMRFLPAKNEFRSGIIELSIDQKIDLNSLKLILSKHGYIRVNKIDQSLQFASRGDILDIYSVNYDNPIRIEFFDDTIESIKFFDIATQESIEKVQCVKIIPASDVFLTDEEIQNLKINVERQINKDKEIYGGLIAEKMAMNFSNDLEDIEARQSNQSTYRFLSYGKDKTESIISYCRNPLIFISNKQQVLASSDIVYKESLDYLSELTEESRIPSHLEFYNQFQNCIDSKHCVYNSINFSDDSYELKTRPIVYAGTSIAQIEPTLKEYINHSNKIIIALTNVTQISTITQILKEMGADYEKMPSFAIPDKKIGIVIKQIDEGFELVSGNIAVITSHELFGQNYHNSRFSSRFKEATILNSYEDLHPGDYIVHEYNGIGQFIDIKTLDVDGIKRDFLHIAYSGSDVLYVPLSQFKLVRKYAGREGAKPKLSNLNSDEWSKTKAKIKKRVNDLADKLIALYTERIKVNGFAFKKDDEIQRMFEDEFPYELTDDQITAMKEIKDDMEKPYPMDRLLCGDVGFGKTEIAFRAAFKAISNGKQVALLCPTTLLARQHYDVATERFMNFGVRIAMFSRLIPPKRQKVYIDEIKEGKIDLIIGTHRLLSKSIVYKDLGLLIVDEEQRFGVEQKERIKALKTNIDVLTLSATPIPRTLQMSLVGLRQYSQINTAPTNRMPIQTYVLAHRKEVIKELIERELARNGQAFYVYNRVESIYSVASELHSMVSGARIGVVHGQMNRNEIENVMEQFYNGDINVLVCTSIIENGIDIPNANLIIVEDADTFGLSQLYQIKGRVGRGDRVAYAYLLYRDNKVMNEDAVKRLKAIKEFTELGSGYKIAQRDLMIRGAGDILGPEQAGYIDTLGMDLYMKMLNDAVKGKKEEIEEVKPNKLFSIDAFIPQEYAEKSDKIELYQEIENAKNNAELNQIRLKMRDIYGKLPNEVELLLTKRKIDILVESGAIKNMVEYNDCIDIFLDDKFSKINGIGNKLFDELSQYLEFIRVSFINRELKIRFMKHGDWLTNLEKIVSKIVKLYFSSVIH